MNNEIERLEAFVEVSNLLSKYKYLHVAGMVLECADLYAKRDDSICHSIWGYYKGWDSINRFYTHMRMINPPAMGPGTMFEYPLTTPLIEIAGDGKTAKAVWWCPGHETTPIPQRKGEPLHAQWAFIKYANDLIKMADNKWYLWHHFIILTFFTDYHRSWAGGGGLPPELDLTEKPPGLEEDGKAFIKDDFYSPTNLYREYLPAAPDHYETYNGDMKWIDPKPERYRTGGKR
jgi:hypothetical protein